MIRKMLALLLSLSLVLSCAMTTGFAMDSVTSDEVGMESAELLSVEEEVEVTATESEEQAESEDEESEVAETVEESTEDTNEERSEEPETEVVTKEDAVMEDEQCSEEETTEETVEQVDESTEDEPDEEQSNCDAVAEDTEVIETSAVEETVTATTVTATSTQTTTEASTGATAQSTTESGASTAVENKPSVQKKQAENVLVVSLKGGKSNAKSNYNKLMNAFKKAKGKKMLTVRIQSKGKYYVKSGGGGALMIRPYTTLDLNGAELCRAGDMTNLLQNCNASGRRKGKGYNLSSHIVVKNGILNGSGGDSDACNLVNFGHATNLSFENLKFLNCRGGHLLELSGCKNAVIQNCSFSGYKRSGGEPAEAIQLDICNGKLGWNGVYADGSSGDYTPCKNITVQNCAFKNYPSGVGNHHTVKGRHNSNIKILNNTFTSTMKYNEPAIWCYGFDNSEVSGDTITGHYSYGVRVSGGSVKVNNNSLGTAKKKIGYQGIYIVKANADIKGSSGSRRAESVKGGTVNGNVFYLSSKKAGIWVSNGKLSSVCDNKVYAGSKRVVSVSGGAKISKKANNTAV